MDNFVVENLGPIAKAEVEFGDLTILTGPQASGKTLFLETFKLVKDFGDIILDYSEQYSHINFDELLNYYYGDGMYKVISLQTGIAYNKEQIDIKSIINFNISSSPKLPNDNITPDSKSQLYNNLLNIGGTTELMSLSPFFKTIAIPLAGLSTIYSNEGASLKFYNTIMNALKQIRDNNNKLSDLEKKAIDTLENAVREKVFFIPAQRSSAISEGRIQLSRDFVNSPYILIKFSGYLQQFVKSQQNGLISETIKNYDFLKDTEINMRRSAGSPRLEMTINKQTIPYMAWSTGQRELTPLLMSLEYFESIPNKDYIIIEEPEIGLHPRAIIEFMFTVLKLMKSGVKVVISTHSSTPLDFVWAMNHLKESNADIANIAEMFDFKIKDKSVFDGLAEKVIKVYYFSPDKKTRKVYSKDISSLDVYSEDEDVSNWGGMSLSADRAGSIVSKF